MSDIISVAIDVYSILVIFRVLMSWFKGARAMPGAQWVYEVTEPSLKFARSVIPPISGIDFSPIWVLLGLDILNQIIRAII